MATKTFYMADSTVNSWQAMIESAQSAATIASGWTVSTGATNHSEYAQGVKRAATTFTSTTPPDGTLDTSLFDAWRSQNAYSGTFASGNWTFNFVVRASSSATGQLGRVRFRMIKANSDGSSPTEITSGQQSCSITGTIATGSDATSSLTFNPGAITLSNQYLFIQIAWERTTGASMTTADVVFRTGSSGPAGSYITTTDFQPFVVGTSAPSTDASTGSAAGTVLIKGTSAPTLADATSSASGKVLIRGTSAPTLADATSSATGSTAIRGTSAASTAAATGSAAGVVGTPTEWPQIQDQVDAGYPKVSQPAPLTAQYVEYRDYGTVISGTQITVTMEATTLTGTVDVVPTISTRKLASDPWIDNVNLWQAFATDFQFLKVTLDFTAADKASQMRVDQLNIRLDVQFITDSGTAEAYAADVAGTEIPFNLEFVDVRAITVTPQGDTPCFWTVDFVDVPNPTSFFIYFFDELGNRINKTFRWSANGV